MGKVNCKTRRESFKVWDLLRLILKIYGILFWFAVRQWHCPYERKIALQSHSGDTYMEAHCIAVRQWYHPYERYIALQQKKLYHSCRKYISLRSNNDAITIKSILRCSKSAALFLYKLYCFAFRAWYYYYERYIALQSGGDTIAMKVELLCSQTVAVSLRKVALQSDSDMIAMKNVPSNL